LEGKREKSNKGKGKKGGKRMLTQAEEKANFINSIEKKE